MANFMQICSTNCFLNLKHIMFNILYKNKEFQLHSEVELRKFLSNKDKKELKKILIEFPEFIVTAEEYLLHSK